MKKKIATAALAACLATAMCASLAACGDPSTNDPKNPNDPPPATQSIAAPTEFSIADNAYSFKGVTDASRYQMNFYTSETAADYAYTIAITARAAITTYTGSITTVQAGTYTVKLYAYDADDESSEPAVINSCEIKANLSDPQIEYWYDASLGKLDLQLFNFDVYQTQSTPNVKVTLTDLTTNTAETQSFTVDAITAAYDKLTSERSDYPYIEFDVEDGHSYSVKAIAETQTTLAVSSPEITAFETIETGKVNKRSDGFDAVWSSNVNADSIAELDVTVTDEFVLSSENSTATEIADGALMNFRYRQANDSGRKTGFKRDFGYGIKAVKDATAVDGCTHSYTLTYNQGTNTGTGHIYLKADGVVEFTLDPPASGVPVGGTFTGSWLYIDGAQTKVAVNISINNLVNMFSDAD